MRFNLEHIIKNYSIGIDIDDNLQAFDNETAFSHFNDYWRV